MNETFLQIDTASKIFLLCTIQVLNAFDCMKNFYKTFRCIQGFFIFSPNFDGNYIDALFKIFHPYFV